MSLYSLFHLCFGFALTFVNKLIRVLVHMMLIELIRSRVLIKCQPPAKKPFTQFRSCVVSVKC